MKNQALQRRKQLCVPVQDLPIRLKCEVKQDEKHQKLKHIVIILGQNYILACSFIRSI